MSITRTRLTPDASRTAALEAARALLIEYGPQSVTLKAVAARIGRSHANLLHHFGSAAGLQSALAASMAERITQSIGLTVARVRAGEIEPRAIVDMAFDAFGRDGAGALASWMILSGDRAALDPVLDAIHRLIDEIGPNAEIPVRAVTLSLVLTALGDALLGESMAGALGLPRDTARRMALERLFGVPDPDGMAQARGSSEAG